MYGLEEVIVEFHRFGLPKIEERILKLPTNLDKAITVIGLRRTGKTYLLYQTIQELLSKGMKLESMFYIDFEDERLDDLGSKDLSKIIELYKKYNPESKTIYLFLDEIQNINGWEKFIRRILERRDTRVFLTGSSSKLLSREIATTLRGRNLSFHLLPLSFQEYLNFKNFVLRKPLIEDDRGIIKRYLEEYMKYGGFPELTRYEDIIKIRTLHEYLNLIVYKDLVERYNIEKIDVMKTLIKIVVRNFANRVSIKKFHDILLSTGRKLSKNKIYEYFSYLEDIGFIIPIRRYSYSEIESFRSLPKIYLIDNGFPTIYGLKDIGHRMENLVALQLIRKKYYLNPTLEIKYYLERNNGEVDFIVTEGVKIKELIQVCYDPTDPYTKNREINSLIKASEQLGCRNLKIITWDYEDEIKIDGKIIRCIPLWRWLLG